MTKIAEASLTRVFAVFTLGAASVALAGCSLLGGTTAPSPNASSGADVFSIKVGDCLNDSSINGQTSTVPVVDCAKPHDSEVYLDGNLKGGNFPGDSAIQNEAESVCGGGFAAFVGAPYEQGTGYSYSYFTPSAKSWATGDRLVSCVVFDPTGTQVTGTLKGAEG
ncbi:MAG: septum formation family protein [Rhodoglobus sp.]